MTKQELVAQIKQKRSFLCVGLDTDIQKIPSFLLEYEHPVLEFNKRIIEATEDLCVAYKPNTAFYECRGIQGWYDLVHTLEYIPKNIFTIADAKRGDIGNTSKMYAEAFFNPQSSGMNFDAVTVAPYMGEDSIRPFLSFEDKWAIVLALTSNIGSDDFQQLSVSNVKLFEQVITKTQEWASAENMMYVVGATHPESFKRIREWAQDYFLLVPGVGAQGGSLQEVCQYGLNEDIGLLINSSRAIIYASNGRDFAEKARIEAQKVQQEMEQILSDNQMI